MTLLMNHDRYEALREASALHRELEALESTMRQWAVDPTKPYKLELAKISTYFVASRSLGRGMTLAEALAICI